ncbi:hypothetical protein EDI_237440 [Entamoeba dispar SAW760]|uniref:Uncharacterized protein n=1 Tax=Entamoeba dispar (strain ATCC PRA-260 / SAW760) TaxID=370354 RepID=B0EP86_ENTDS|nr:uncharacterized protein EDI_237440 [Entamoeba dispar SAW760]EDR23657.1 hypothetical protein EDI_237440 [Entamoeba dispar SAW760]|eukprot:EDR23657.1 hypothetical protein EDI_237440 [Entamoeba dispar SAW760]
MGCCSSNAEVDENQPLLSVVENLQPPTINETPTISRIHTQLPLTEENSKMIKEINAQYLSKQNNSQNQIDDIQQYIKEIKKKTKIIQTKEIFALPKSNKNDVEPEFDLQFLRSILQTNINIISEEYNKTKVTKATNLIVPLDNLQ